MNRPFSIALLAILFAFGCQPANNKSEKEVQDTQPATPAAPVTTCYKLLFEKDISVFELTVAPDNSASGFIAWVPFETDGARGWFEGKKEGNLYSGDFTYMTEGSMQIEEVVFKEVENGISKGRGALDVSGERLTIIDKSNLVFEDIYKTADCAGIAEHLQDAKEVTKMIKEERAKRYETLTGTYEYDLGEDRGSGELDVKQLDNNQVRVEFLIVAGSPAFNQGSGGGIVTLDENLSGDYSVDEFGGNCRIRFSFKGKKVITKMLDGTPADCGFGNNVFMDQEFEKISAKDPFVKNAEE